VTPPPVRIRRSLVFQAASVLVVAAVLAALWKWTDLRGWADADRLVEALEPHRTRWYAAPLVLLAFVVAELFLFPVLVLVFVCGLVFGPWLGSIYALVGAIGSSILPFYIGRRLGRRKLERLGGRIVAKLGRVLERRGVVAVFLVRKVPAPFTIVNMICGASPVSLRDFVLGTLLGMGTGTLLLTILGGRLVDILRSPDLGQLALGVVILLLPLGVAILVQRRINQRLEVGR